MLTIGLQGPGSVPLELLDCAEQSKKNRAAQLGSKFFQDVAVLAKDEGIAIDILAAGMAAVNTPLLSKMAMDTGGVLLLHQSKPSAAFFGPFLIFPGISSSPFLGTK